MSGYAPADVEAGVTYLLNAGLTPPVSTKVPNPRPAEHVRVTSTGGQQRNLIQVDSRVLIECWGATETDALNIARKAWALLWSAQDSYISPDVYASKIESSLPVNFPDPDADPRSRYQFLSTVTTALEEIA